jgi:hypothetical protein
MNRIIPLCLVISLMGSGAVLADDDCHSPMSQWQSRDAAAAHVKSLGISADRMRIDDGCYEARGRDADGNRVELKIDPTNFALIELEVKFERNADPSRYLPGARGGTATSPHTPPGDQPAPSVSPPAPSGN